MLGWPNLLDDSSDSDSEFLDFGAERGTRNAQSFRSLGLVAVAFLKDYCDQLPFDFFDDIVVKSW